MEADPAVRERESTEPAAELEVDTEEILAEDPNRALLFLKELLAHGRRSPTVAFAYLAIGVVAVFGALPGLVSPHEPMTTDLGAVLNPPSLEHLLGTDQFGRDIFSRIVHGTRISLYIGFASVGIAAGIGGVLGLIAGYVRGAVDSTVMRLMDVLLAFPGVLLALAIIAIAGRSVTNLVLAVGISLIPAYARVMRSEVVSVRERPYVEAARAAGTREIVVALRHVLPNSLSSLVVLGAVGVGLSILIGSAASFLGLGPRPPTPEWGAMLSDGRNYIARAWWIATFPGLAITITVLAVNIVGDVLKDIFDPRSDALLQQR